MNRYIFSYILTLAIVLISLPSCEHLDTSLPTQQAGETTLKVVTRAANGSTLIYPLHMYAFSSNGELYKHSTVASENSPATMALPQDKSFRIVVVSADESVYELPANASLSSVINVKNTGNANGSYTVSSPLQMGFIDVSTTSNQSVSHIQLQYQVAALNMTLRSMPMSCKGVSVTVSSPFEGMDFNGKGQGNKAIMIDCHKENDNSWTTGTLYVFPTSGSNTVFTIKYNNDEGEQFTSATYQATLKAGTPYTVEGTYADGTVNFSGDVTPAQWSAPVNISFTFNSGVNPVIPGEDVPDSPATPDFSDAVKVTSIPGSHTVWDGHIVAAVLNADGITMYNGMEPRATLLLLSLSDWNKMTSALNTENPTTAFKEAEDYAEYSITGWTIPTEDQARLLYSAYQNEHDGITLEEIIANAKGTAIALTEGSENARYLCAGAEKTFGFYSNRITAAGKAAKNYHLRLVKALHVSLE